MSVRSVALIQAAYYVGAGLWSLASIRTFEAVTGPKTDRWLVKTVGVVYLLDAAVELALVAGWQVAGRRDRGAGRVTVGERVGR
jgi:hypothetical protein